MRFTPKFILVIALCALVLLTIAPVSAETLTGTLGSIATAQSVNYDTNSGTQPAAGTANVTLNINDIQSTTGLSAYVHFDPSGKLFSHDADMPSYGVSGVPFTAKTFGGVTIGTGTFGWQRLWDSSTPAVEQPGYQYFLFDSWTGNELTGDYRILIDINKSAIYNPGLGTYGIINSGPVDPGRIGFSLSTVTTTETFGYTGQNLMNVRDDVLNDYTATKPDGLGITGTITKQVGGITYPSRAWVFDQNGTPISSEDMVTSTNFSFNTIEQTIIIGIQSPNNYDWYNTSVLFAAPTPTVTPTPTTTIPPGHIVTYFRTFDPLTNSNIYGADINLYDVEADEWTNYSADADGRGEIYTLPYHTVNAYAHYPEAGVYNDAELLAQDTGYSGGKLFYLDMYPYTPTPASGYTELYITTRNRDDKSPVTYASIGITTISTGAYYGTNSGSTGTDVSIFPNNTSLKILVTKSGYTTATTYTNTGTGDKKYVTIDLDRAAVTPIPTSTIPPGGVTPVITQDPNDPALHGGDTSLKGQEMMNWLAMNGMDLVQLCFMVTVLALLGVKFGGKR